MKKSICILLFLTAFYSFLACEDAKYYTDQYIEFQEIENEKIDYHRGKDDPAKVRVLVNYIGQEDLKVWNPCALSPLLYKQLREDGFQVNKEHLYKLMEENDFFKSGTYSLGANYYNYYGRIIYNNYLPNSYNRLIYQNQVIGEYYMYTTGIHYGNAYDKDYFNLSYEFVFVVKDKLAYITADLVWGDFSGICDAFPELFEQREDGKYYWVSQEAQYKFCEILNSEDYVKLPDTIRYVRDVKDMIVKTLKLKE